VLTAEDFTAVFRRRASANFASIDITSVGTFAGTIQEGDLWYFGTFASGMRQRA